jgi:predicted membrane GTPase involved in stress response
VDTAAAGDIVSITGIEDGTVNDTLADPLVEEPLPVILML